jgi:hypothetical protein
MGLVRGSNELWSLFLASEGKQEGNEEKKVGAHSIS